MHLGFYYFTVIQNVSENWISQILRPWFTTINSPDRWFHFSLFNSNIWYKLGRNLKYKTCWTESALLLALSDHADLYWFEWERSLKSLMLTFRSKPERRKKMKTQVLEKGRQRYCYQTNRFMLRASRRECSIILMV